MLNPNDLKSAIATGLSMVCATCKKYTDAQERGLDKCLSVDGCGGPMRGDTFHEYEGPITDFLRYCFVCGGPSTKGIRVAGHTRLIGACENHVEYVKHLAPEGPKPRLPLIDARILDGRTERSAQEAIKTHYSLGALMRELSKPKEA